MHKNTTLIITLLLICLIIIYYSNNSSKEKFDYRTINQGVSGFKIISGEKHYICDKKEKSIYDKFDLLLCKNKNYEGPILGENGKGIYKSFININPFKNYKKTKNV